MTVSVIQSAPHHISVDGQKITYRTAGDPSNPPIVMVHGWLSHSRVWRFQMEQLQATHFCIAIDLLGFGDSDSPRNGDYSIEAQGRRVLALADALNLDKFTLMGHSMGGQIAIFIAAVLAPGRVTRLIDVGGVVSGALAWWPKYISKNQMWLGQVAPFLVPPTVWLFRVPWVSKVAFGVWFHIAPPFEVWAEDRERAMQPGTIPSGYPAVRAIMTTDLVQKTAQSNLELKKGKIRIAGMTKGSGMIQPNMATTLGYVMTDANISVKDLKAILTRATDLSYNRLTVDGDTSTNDTVVLLANGASGIKPNPEELKLVAEAVTNVLKSLAAQIARDGEGAKKLVRVLVTGAKTEQDANLIGRAIANSPLVKTAIAGSDPNWGRIICAAGYSGANFDPAKVDIYLQGKRVCKAGLAAPFDENKLKLKLDEKDVVIDLRIAGNGKGTAEFWTCDFTEGYIEINGSYRT